MIDTVKFLIPVANPVVLRKISQNMERTQRKDLKTGITKFEYFRSDITLGSYYSNIAVKVSDYPIGLMIEFSLPKYWIGDNIRMIYASEISEIISKLYPQLCSFVGFNLPPFVFWEIYRLDICYAWDLPNLKFLKVASNFVRQINYPRKKKYVYDTSVMFKGSSYVVKFYEKGAEFKRHDYKKIFDRNPNQAVDLYNLSSTVFRFEVGLRRRYLENYFVRGGFLEIGERVTVKDISNDFLIKGMLKYYLGRIFKFIKKEAVQLDDVKAKLLNKHSVSKATKLYIFYKGFYLDDDVKDMFLLGGLDRSTIYRNKKALEKAGIGIPSIDDKIDPFRELNISLKSDLFANEKEFKNN